MDLCTHLVLPWHFIGRAFRDEDKVGATAVKLRIKRGRTRSKENAYAMPAINANQPQSLPITSTTKAREWLYAVELMLSMASQIRWRAVGAPMVMSVIHISLSMDPTSPTIRRWVWASRCSSVIFPMMGYER